MVRDRILTDYIIYAENPSDTGKISCSDNDEILDRQCGTGCAQLRRWIVTKLHFPSILAMSEFEAAYRTVQVKTHNRAVLRLE